MSIFSGSKTELQEKIVKLEIDLAVKNELLSEKSQDVIYLRKQVDRLQNALLAIEHPQTYQTLKDDQFIEDNPDIEETEADVKRREEAAIMNNYMQQMENPTFRDADDMYDMLGGRIGPPQAEPLHHDNES